MSGGKNYSELARNIVKYIGGEKNVKSVSHCVTRLRFRLVDDKLANKQELEKIEGVISIVLSGDQYQVVIGKEVGIYYEAMLNQYNFGTERSHDDTDENAAAKKEQKVGNPFSRFLLIFPSIFTPILPILGGAGMLKALLLIFTTFGLLSGDSPTYKILSAAANSTFYFLPLLLAVTSAKVFKVNVFSALVIVAALLEPNFTGLMTANGDISSFMGIPVVMMSYASTVVPSILAVWLYSYLEKFLTKYTPQSIAMFAVPLISLLIMVPATAIVIGPVGVSIATGLGNIMMFLNEKSPIITGAVIGGTWTFLIMFGVHWGVVPIMVNNIGTLGYDTIRPMVASANFAQAGAALGVLLKSKKIETRTFAASAITSIFVGGITEPAVYGISVKYKKPMIAAVIGGAVSGAFMGIMGVQVNTYILASLLTLPAFFGPTFVYYIIGLLIAMVVTALLTYIFGIEED